MKIFDERKSSAEEISRLLKKKAFDEVELSPRVAAGTEKMFGQKLTAPRSWTALSVRFARVGTSASFTIQSSLTAATY